MTEKRRPKIVLQDDIVGLETVDAAFRAIVNRFNAENANAEEQSLLPKPPPEEEKPVRRRSQLLEQKPLWGGKRKPDPAPRDANT